MNFLILTLAAGLLGEPLVRLLDAKCRAERVLIRMAGGTAVFGAVVMIAGSASLSWTMWGVLVLAVAGVFVFRRTFSAAPLRLRLACLAWDERAALGVIVFVFVAWGVLLAAPVTGWDATVAHVALAKDYLRESHIGLMPGNSYSAFPQMMQSLYAAAMWNSGAYAACLVNAGFGALACLAAYVMGARLHDRRAGLYAAAAAATMPVFIDHLGAPGVDLPFAAMVLCALACWMIGSESNDAKWMAFAGLLLGASCGIRHTGYYAAGLAVGLTLCIGPRRMKHSALLGAGVLVGALPWLLRGYVLTGNPVYPFLASWMPAAGLPSDDLTQVAQHESVRMHGVFDTLFFYWNVVIHPGQYDGWSQSPGVLALALGVPGLLVCGRYARGIGAFSFVGVTGLFFFRQFARYLFPFYLPMMPVAAAAALRMPKLRPLAMAVLAMSYGVGLAITCGAALVKFPAAVGLQSDEAYLQERVERYEAFSWMNRSLPKDAVVLCLDPRTYYLDRKAYNDFEMLKDLVPMNEADRLAWLRNRGITHVMLPLRYMTDSPGFEQTGIQAVLDAWAADGAHFKKVAGLALVSPRDGAPDVVNVYEVLSEENGVR